MAQAITEAYTVLMMQSKMAAISGTPLAPLLEARLERELDSSEQLVWLGQPLPKNMAKKCIIIALFGVVFLSFSVFFFVDTLSMALQPKAPGGGGGAAYVLPMMAIPFVLSGIGLVSTPLIAAHRAKKTLYAITDQRVLTQTPGYWGGIVTRSYLPEQLEELQRLEHSDGSGDLFFGEQHIAIQFLNEDASSTPQRGLFGVADVTAVERIIRQTHGRA